MPLFRLLSLAGAAISLCLVAAGTARAQAEQPAGSTSSIDVARSVAVTGREAFNAGDYDTAIALFRQAYSLFPAPTLVLYEARSLEKMGRLLEAALAYDRALQVEIAPDAPPQFAAAVETAREEGQRLRARIPSLTLNITGASTTSPDLTVTINGRAIGAAQLGHAQQLNPGKYRIEARIGAHRSDSAEVELTSGHHSQVSLDLSAGNVPVPPAPEGTPSAPEDQAASVTQKDLSGLPVMTYVSAGVALVGVGAGVVTGVMASKKHSEASELCQGGCRADDEGPDAVSDFRSLRTLSSVAYGVGAAGAVGAVVFWLTAPNADASSDEAGLTPWFDGNSAGIRGVF